MECKAPFFVRIPYTVKLPFFVYTFMCWISKFFQNIVDDISFVNNDVFVLLCFSFAYDEYVFMCTTSNEQGEHG